MRPAAPAPGKTSTSPAIPSGESRTASPFPVITCPAASFLGLVGLFYLAGYDTIFFIVNLILSWAVVLFLIAEKLRNPGFLYLRGRGFRQVTGAADYG